MAFNNFPNFYQYPMQQNQMQNNGFVSVRSEIEARNYPVAYGNSVTFKDETSPYVYTKTMGFSQLDPPVFEKYKLVKEEAQTPKPIDDMAYVKGEIESLWESINELKERRYERNSNVKSVPTESNGDVKPKIQHSTKS